MNNILRIITLTLALLGVSPAFASCTGQFLGGTVCGNNTTLLGIPGPTANPILGVPGVNTGTLGFAGSSSGTATISAQAAAGAATLLLPTTSGTLPSSASAPLVLNATTGVLTCPTCVTVLTNGVTPTSGYSNTQILSSNGSVLSAYSVSGTGNVALTNAPVFSTIQFAGSGSGTVTITAQAAAGTPTLTLPNTSGTLADGASSPLALDAATGNLTCSTCLTTTSSFANPTASVGLTAVNGSATTAMRSDGAPPLSASVQSALTGTIHQILTGSGAFGFSANPLNTISAAGAFQIDAGFGATSVLYFPSNFANSSICYGNGCTNLVHNAGTFTASIGPASDVLTVTAIISGSVPVERLGTATLSGTGVTVGTQIRAQLSGTPGGIGTYTISPGPQTVGAETMTAISLQGYYNTSTGLTNFLNATTASYNSFYGFETGEFCTTCFANSGFGEANQIYNIDGGGNSSFGWKALLGTLSIGLGDYNTAGGYASGWAAGQAAPTSRNTSYGAFSLSAAALAGNDISAFGYNAAGTTTAGPNALFGANSGSTLTTGVSNLFAAANAAGAGVITGSYNVVLGGCSGLSATLTSMVEFCDGTGAVAFRNDSNRDTYLGDGATGRKVYNYFSTATNAAGTTADASGIWHVFTGTAGLTNWLNIYPDGSTTLGAPTGANKGAGTLNVQGSIYDNGTAPSGTAGSGYVQATAGTLTNATLATRLNKGIYIVCMSAATGMSITGTLTETTLATCTIPANAMGSNGALRITTQWSKTGTAGNMETRTKFGGTTYLDQGATGSASAISGRQQTEIHNRNATNSQIGTAIGQTNWGFVTTASITTALDTTANQDVTLTCQLGNTGDTCELSSYEVELIRP